MATAALLRYTVRFDVDEYVARVYAHPGRSFPAVVTVCAPAACTAELVARYVFPEFHVPGFDEGNLTLWPRLGKEVLAARAPAEADGSGVEDRAALARRVAVALLRYVRACVASDLLVPRRSV